MGTILAISQNVFRGVLRGKIFISLLLFAIGLILLSKLLEFLTFTAQIKLIFNFREKRTLGSERNLD